MYAAAIIDGGVVARPEELPLDDTSTTVQLSDGSIRRKANQPWCYACRLHCSNLPNYTQVDAGVWSFLVISSHI
jgi:hypothetical protein